MILISTEAGHTKRFTSPAVAWEWLRKMRPAGDLIILRMWLRTAAQGQSRAVTTKAGATRLEVL